MLGSFLISRCPRNDSALFHTDSIKVTRCLRFTSLPPNTADQQTRYYYGQTALLSDGETPPLAGGRSSTCGSRYTDRYSSRQTIRADRAGILPSSLNTPAEIVYLYSPTSGELQRNWRAPKVSPRFMSPNFPQVEVQNNHQNPPMKPVTSADLLASGHFRVQTRTDVTEL